MQDNLIAVLNDNCDLIVKVKILQEQMFKDVTHFWFWCDLEKGKGMKLKDNWRTLGRKAGKQSPIIAEPFKW